MKRGRQPAMTIGPFEFEWWEVPIVFLIARALFDVGHALGFWLALRVLG